MHAGAVDVETLVSLSVAAYIVATIPHPTPPPQNPNPLLLAVKTSLSILLQKTTLASKIVSSENSDAQDLIISSQGGMLLRVLATLTNLTHLEDRQPILAFLGSIYSARDIQSSSIPKPVRRNTRSSHLQGRQTVRSKPCGIGLMGRIGQKPSWLTSVRGSLLSSFAEVENSTQTHI